MQGPRSPLDEYLHRERTRYLLFAFHEKDTDNESDAQYKLDQRLKFHCPDPSLRSYPEALRRCRAYEERVARVLGPIADEHYISRNGFWTMNEFRSKLRQRMYADGVEERSEVMQAYDQLLRDLNNGDSYDPSALIDVAYYMNSKGFIKRLLATLDSSQVNSLMESDPAFKGCFKRIENGGRDKADVRYVKNKIRSTRL
jgi:hypothetical protein